MVTGINQGDVADYETLALSIASVMEHRRVVNAPELARLLCWDEGQVNHCLKQLLAVGKVEVLRPVSPVHEGPGLEYYRWVHRTERDYIWQAELLARPRPTRHKLYDSHYY